MKKILSKIRIPLDNLTKNELEEIKQMHGKTIILESEEPCLTCGRHKRMRYTQRVDGKLWLVEECLFCAVRVKTKRNQETQ